MTYQALRPCPFCHVAELATISFDDPALVTYQWACGGVSTQIAPPPPPVGLDVFG